MGAIGSVRVTTTTEVVSTTGEVLASITLTDMESGGNPAYVTRMAHRRAEANADNTRKMLQVAYGEVEEAWKDKS